MHVCGVNIGTPPYAEAERPIDLCRGRKLVGDVVEGRGQKCKPHHLHVPPCHPESIIASGSGRCKATWKREFKHPWREAGPPNHLDELVDSDQEVVNKELSLCSRGARPGLPGPPSPCAALPSRIEDDSQHRVEERQHRVTYRDTSLRNRYPLGPCSRPMRRALRSPCAALSFKIEDGSQHRVEESQHRVT